jgi:hypothetical protein
VLRRLREAIRPRSVIQELCNAAFIVTAITIVSIPVLNLGLIGVLFPHGVALGLWLAAGWMWLRGVGE